MTTGGTASDPSTLRLIRIVTVASDLLRSSAGTSQHTASRVLSFWISSMPNREAGCGRCARRSSVLRESSSSAKAGARPAAARQAVNPATHASVRMLIPLCTSVHNLPVQRACAIAAKSPRPKLNAMKDSPQGRVSKPYRLLRGTACSRPHVVFVCRPCVRSRAEGRRQKSPARDRARIARPPACMARLGGACGMSELQDAEQTFAAALRDLRRSNLAAFELWLKGTDDRPAARSAIAEEIASSRRKLAHDFVTGKAAAIVEALNAGAKAHILRQLGEFATLGDLPAVPGPGAPGQAGRWSGAVRAALGAALGAGAALLVLSALAIHGVRVSSAAPPPATSHIAAQAPVGDTAAPAPSAPPSPPSAPPNPLPKADAHAAATPSAPAPTAPAPDARPQPPAPARGGAPAAALPAVGGAFGAAIGALAVAMPARAGRRTKRGPRGGIAIAVLLLGAAGLAGRWLAGPAPWWSALLAVAAALAVWLVRAFAPSDAPAPASDHAAAAAALERQLLVDSAIWTALASGLVLGDTGSERSARQLDQVRAVILAHRGRGDTGEEILRVVEQELGLPSAARGAASAGEPPAWPDFSWTPRHAREFETFGIVEPGDLVRVKIPPQAIVDNGATRIVQKGVVVRKS